ncbi:MAG: amino acid transporter substrate-binding protein [Rhodoglobus sp.]|nr:amino acid transporter substrate-binding protein [Rhodoglobus sp.]
MRVRVAYVEEPPFYWTGAGGSATGADIELSRVVLEAIGATIDYQLVPFEDLLTGVAAGRWDMNVPIFVTPERAERVAFSIPVWSLGDGVVVRRGNPTGVTSYAAVASSGARLGVIPGQVQREAARAAGIDDRRIVEFDSQPAAVAALLAGAIDAFAATTVGNRAIVAAHPELESVDLEPHAGAKPPVGAFSFALENRTLREAVDAQLGGYLGSTDHRRRAAAYGISDAEIDGALA